MALGWWPWAGGRAGGCVLLQAFAAPSVAHRPAASASPGRRVSAHPTRNQNRHCARGKSRPCGGVKAGRGGVRSYAGLRLRRPSSRPNCDLDELPWASAPSPADCWASVSGLPEQGPQPGGSAPQAEGQRSDAQVSQGHAPSKGPALPLQTRGAPGIPGLWPRRSSPHPVPRRIRHLRLHLRRRYFQMRLCSQLPGEESDTAPCGTRGAP